MEMGELGAGGADIDADADDDAVKDGSEGEDEETTFYDLPDVPIEGPGGAESRISGYAGDAARFALVDEFYEYTERTQGIRRPTDIDYDRFVVGSDGRTLELQVGVNKTVQITAHVGTSKFLRLDTIARRIGRGALEPSEIYSTCQVTALNPNRLPRSSSSKERSIRPPKETTMTLIRPSMMSLVLWKRRRGLAMPLTPWKRRRRPMLAWP